MGQIHVFRFLQIYLIGFKSRLWLGHSKTFTALCISHSSIMQCTQCTVCLRSLSCWKVNILPRLRFWMLWTGFSSQYFGALSCSSILMNPSVLLLKNSPTAWGFYQHTLLLGWYSACDEQCLLSFEHDAWNWGSSDQRIWCLTVWGSFRCFFVNFKCVFMCLHWREDWVWPHCYKAQIGGVLQWCLSFCRFLLSEYTIMELN